MANFKKYLVVSTETSSLSRDEFQLDRVAWRDLVKIKNLNDYDQIIINLNAVNEKPPENRFQHRHLVKVFDQSSWMHILLSGGRIFIVGKPNSEFIASNDNGNIIRVKPLQALLNLTEDIRRTRCRRSNRSSSAATKSSSP